MRTASLIRPAPRSKELATLRTFYAVHRTCGIIWAKDPLSVLIVETTQREWFAGFHAAFGAKFCVMLIELTKPHLRWIFRIGLAKARSVRSEQNLVTWSCMAGLSIQQIARPSYANGSQ